MRMQELWRDHVTGQVWAIELRDGLVTGCFGPLEHADVNPEMLHRYDYSGDHAEWVEQHRDRFDLYNAVGV
ncbi:MAG TPA: hypothetical protein VMS63_01125 [Gaiellaceae bacterium]|jgi:hypothetical protein|nr:hypothetical protein [Gaiellaceae bacterium]